MINIEITKEVVDSFTGTVLALLSGGIIWFLKSAFEKHKFEVLALAKLERGYAYNLTVLEDNFNFVKEWIKSLKQDRPYSIHFANFIENDEETYKISNLELINQVLGLNYMLQRTGYDLNNTYETYWDSLSKIDGIKDSASKAENLRVFHDNTIKSLEEFLPNYEVIKQKLVETIATVRAAHKVRKHSLFGYLNFLFIDIYPRVTKKSIENQVLILNINIKKKEELNAETFNKEKQPHTNIDASFRRK